MIAVAIGILIIPQITLAAWWNPFSWFKKQPVSAPSQIVEQETKTQVLENRIRELEEKINDRQVTVTPTVTTTTDNKVKPAARVIPPKPVQPTTVTSPTPIPVSPPINEAQTEKYKEIIVVKIVEAFAATKACWDYSDALASMIESRIDDMDSIISKNEVGADTINDEWFTGVIQTLNNIYESENKVSRVKKDGPVLDRENASKAMNQLNIDAREISQMKFISATDFQRMNNLYSKVDEYGKNCMDLEKKAGADYLAYIESQSKDYKFYWDMIDAKFESMLTETNHNDIPVVENDYIPPRLVFPVVSPVRNTSCNFNSYYGGGGGTINCTTY